MPKCLVIVETNEEGITGSSLRLCARLQSFPGWSGIDLSAVVFGALQPQCLEKLAGYGAGDIYHVEGMDPNAFESQKQAVHNLVREHQISLVILPGTLTGRELTPLLAAQLDAGAIAECQELSFRDGCLEAVVEAYDRQYQLIYRLNGQHNVVLMSDIDPGAVESWPAREYNFIAKPAPPPEKLVTEVLETFRLPATELDIGEADVVVGIGRGVESSTDFGIVQELAAAIGAAVAGTRPAVDGGFIPFSRQIGQTGRVIAPQLYIAIGISGAPQHITGVGNAKIVAVNSDPLAPIMRLADLAVMGDLRAVVPLLTDRIKAIKEGRS